MYRSEKLEKYVKRVTGQDYRVEIVKYIRGGFGATTNNDAKRIRICESQKDVKCLLWHEMGHIIMDINDENILEAEVNAQLWAMDNLIKLGYKRIILDSIDWIKDWQTDTRQPTERDEVYKKASKIILRRLGVK